MSLAALMVLWWARGDLNPGPPPCEGGVLTGLDDGPNSQEIRDVLLIRIKLWFLYVRKRG
jgi:hypothetical protein